MNFKSISRIDSRNTHGWYVRVNYEGHQHRKFFSDLKHGDKLSALVAARRYRDELETKLGKPHTDRHVVTRHKRNRSGVIGVRRREYDSYEVQVSLTPRKISKVFVPIENGDEEAAFAKACQIREELLQKAYSEKRHIDF